MVAGARLLLLSCVRRPLQQGKNASEEICQAAPEEEGKTAAHDSRLSNSDATVFDQCRHLVATDQASQAEKQMGGVLI